MSEQTELQRRAAEAIEASRAQEQAKQDRLDALRVAGEERLAAKDAKKQRLLVEQQEALRQRREAQLEQEHAAVKRNMRSHFPGTDAQFEAAWPRILEQLVAAEYRPRRVTPF